jgi:hypothetical protein
LLKFIKGDGGLDFMSLNEGSEGVFEVNNEFLLSVDFFEELEVDFFGHFEGLSYLTEFDEFGAIVLVVHEDLSGLVALAFELLEEVVLVFDVGGVFFKRVLLDLVFFRLILWLIKGDSFGVNFLEIALERRISQIYA